MRDYPKVAHNEVKDDQEADPDDIKLVKHIRRIVEDGHDIEIRKAPDGSLKVLEVRKKYVSIG